MLSVWKRSWKENDSSVNTQQKTLDGPSGTVSRLNSTAAAHPSDVERDKPAHDVVTIHKRRYTDSLEHDDLPRKKIKLQRFDALNVEKDLLEQIQRQNIILILRSKEWIIRFLVLFIIASVEVEDFSHNPTFRSPRTTLLAVKDSPSCAVFCNKLCSLAPALSVRQYERNEKSRGEPWEYFLRNDVVITTPELLHESLSCGELSTTQIHMLIFIDLNETSIQMVMKNLSLETDRLSRPRILGLFSAQQNLLPETSSLESVMDFKVFRLDGYPFNHPSEPSVHFSEVVLFYEKTSLAIAPTLSEELQPLRSSELLGSFVQKNLDDSHSVLDELGTCASDLFWRRALREFNDSRGCEIGIDSDRTSIPDPIQSCVRDWTFTLPNLDPTSSKCNVTHKFIMLVKALRSCEPYGEAFRGIIFVKKRIVALVIGDMLRMLDDTPLFFRPHFLTSNTLHPLNEHKNVLHLFRAGVYNILIMVELHQDIDTSQVSMVVGFDTGFLNFGMDVGPSKTTHIIHMIQKNESRSGSDEHRPNEPLGILTMQCTDDMNPSAFLQDPTTGNHLYLKDSVNAVHCIASAGQLNGITIDKVLFSIKESQVTTESECSYICTVTLLGLVQYIGPPRETESDARNAACFKFCQHLSSIGLLDCSFFPSPVLRVGASDGSDGTYLSSTKSTGTRRYSRREPEFWSNARNTAITSLYPLIISTNPPDNDPQPYAPLVILTRQPLPNLANLKIFHSGIPAVVSVKRGSPLQIKEAQLHDLHLYTLRVCRTLSNKPFECLLVDMVYFFAPLTDTWPFPNQSNDALPFNLPSISEYIHWDLVRLAARSYNTPLRVDDRDELTRDIHDAVIQDRSVEFTRRYTVGRLRPDLSPLSKPLDSPREAGFENILEFTRARRVGFEDLQDITQPLIEVATIPAVLNQLNPTSRSTPQLKSHPKYLIPELCVKCSLPASVLRTARLLPSITQRIDELLLVKELNAKLFDNKISDLLLHMALCTPSCGAEYDYERLELLGDAFLKFISSTYLLVSRPTHKEGSLHNARQDLISNKSLFQHACRTGIPNYIQSKLFSPKLWAPPFFAPLLPANRVNEQAEVVESSVPDQGIKHMTVQNTKKKRKKRRKRGPEEHSQWLGDKAIADVAEAILGAGFLTGGCETALQVTKALGIPILGINTWSDFAKTSTRASFDLSLKTSSLEGVEAIIGYKVKQRQLLSQALSHSSVAGHDSTFTERLEFVGDAILDFLVIRHLYEREQQLTPGGLTLLKAAMVSNSALAAICVCSGLHEHFFHKSPPLQTTIRDYIAKLEVSRIKEYRAAESEGRPPGQFWLDLSAPKSLSDIVESILGAVYVGDQFSTAGIEALFEKLLKPFYNKYITLKTLSHHPTKILFELFQRQGCRQFIIQNDAKEKKGVLTMTQVVVHDIILASAEDRDPTIAARRASLFALDALDGDPGFFARTCDCRIVQTSGKKLATEDRRHDHISVEGKSEMGAGRIMDEPFAVEALPDNDLEEGMILE